jgi:hypothetical protein
MAWRSLRPLPDPQQHALGVDVADLECDDLGDAQPGAVGGGECRLVLRPRRRMEQQRDFLDAQHGRQPARFAHDGEPPRKVRPVERHGEEEAQRRDRTVDAWRPHASLRLVQLETAQILRRRCVGRPANEGRERAHVANVVVARLFAEATHAHVIDHARTQRTDRPVGRVGGHWGSSLEPKVAGPSMLAIGCPDRHVLLLTTPQKRTNRDARASSRKSGFVHGSRAAVPATVAHRRFTFNSEVLTRPKVAVIARAVRPQFRKRSDLSQQDGCHRR